MGLLWRAVKHSWMLIRGWKVVSHPLLLTVAKRRPVTDGRWSGCREVIGRVRAYIGSSRRHMSWVRRAEIRILRGCRRGRIASIFRKDALLLNDKINERSMTLEANIRVTNLVQRHDSWPDQSCIQPSYQVVSMLATPMLDTEEKINAAGGPIHACCVSMSHYKMCFHTSKEHDARQID